MRPVSPTKELRDAFNIRGIPGADATDPRLPVYLSFTSSLTYNLPENQSSATFGDIMVSASAATGTDLAAELQGPVAAAASWVSRFTLGIPIRQSPTSWSIPFAYNHTGGENHETTDRREIDIEITLPGSATYQPAEAQALITINIQDTAEGIRAETQPPRIDLYSQDRHGEKIDMSSAFSDDDESGWRLGVSPMSSPTGLWNITRLDAAALSEVGDWGG